MAGDIYAFLLAFDKWFVLLHELDCILQQKVPIRSYIDSKQVFDAITKSSSPTERRLMIDLHCGKESYNNFEIEHVALICSQQNIAYCMTKAISKHRLRELMKSNNDNVVVTKWIDRKK